MLLLTDQRNDSGCLYWTIWEWLVICFFSLDILRVAGDSHNYFVTFKGPFFGVFSFSFLDYVHVVCVKFCFKAVNIIFKIVWERYWGQRQDFLYMAAWKM